MMGLFSTNFHPFKKVVGFRVTRYTDDHSQKRIRVGCLFVCLFDWLVGWLFVCLFCFVVFCCVLFVCLLAWLVGWFGWLVSLFVCLVSLLGWLVVSGT